MQRGELGLGRVRVSAVLPLPPREEVLVKEV